MRIFSVLFILLFMLSCSAQEIVEILPGQKAVQIVINDFGKSYSDIYLVGQWNAQGKNDGTYSPFIKLEDNGKIHDTFAGDHKFEYKISLDKNQSFYVLIFPDDTTLASSHALAIQEIKVNNEDGIQEITIVPYQRSDVKILVNLEDREIPELFYYCNWDESYIAYPEIIPERYQFFDDGTNGDAKAGDKMYTLMFLGYNIPNSNPYRIIIFDGNSPEASSLSCERGLNFADAHEKILRIAAADQATIRFVVDDSREKKYSSMFLLGNWDMAGNFDSRYSQGFIIMKKNPENIFTFERKITISPQRYNVLFFQDDSSTKADKAIEISYFEVNTTETQEVKIVLPKFNSTQITSVTESRDTIQYLTIICLVFIVISSILTYSFAYGRFLRKNSEFTQILSHSGKNPVMIIESSDKKLRESFAVSICYEYLKNYAYSVSAFSYAETDMKKMLADRYDDFKSYVEYFHPYTVDSFDEKILMPLIEKMDDADVILLIIPEKCSKESIALCKKIFSEFSLPVIVVCESAQTEKNALTFSLNSKKADNFAIVEVSGTEKSQFVINTESGVIKRKF